MDHILTPSVQEGLHATDISPVIGVVPAAFRNKVKATEGVGSCVNDECTEGVRPTVCESG